MARAALPGFDGPYPQYHTIIKEGATVRGQVRSLELSSEIDTAQVGRVGSSTKKTLRKSVQNSGTVNVWVDLDFEEVAAFLGTASAPTTGQTVRLDPTSTPKTITLEQYDGEATASTLKYTHYLYQYVPTSLSMTWDEDGEQVAEIGWEAQDIYTVMA